jgi:hypothetical protein
MLSKRAANEDWYLISLMERVGLAWDVKQPRFSGRREILRNRTVA